MKRAAKTERSRQKATIKRSKPSKKAETINVVAAFVMRIESRFARERDLEATVVLIVNGMRLEMKCGHFSSAEAACRRMVRVFEAFSKVTYRDGVMLGTGTASDPIVYQGPIWIFHAK